MLRFIICVLVVILDFVIMIPIEIVGFIIGLFSKNARNHYMRLMMNMVFSVINFLTGAKVTCLGLDKIPKNEPVLYVANHESFFDVLLVLPRLPGFICFVAKTQFAKIPIFAQALYLYNTLFIDRDDIKQGLKTILQAIENVKTGLSVFIFPEGTRSRNGKMADFKEGSMKISTKSGCRIVPVAITNSADVFEKHFPKVKAANVVIEFLDPIDPASFDKTEQKHLGRKCHDLIEVKRDENFEKYCRAQAE